MKPLWLLGARGESGIARSPSPAMHNAGLTAMGLQPVYRLHPCGADGLVVALEHAEGSCRGFNVTAPHKVCVAERYAAVLDDDARAASAVNTVVFADDADASGRFPAVACNTDVGGLVTSWRRANFHVEGRTVAVVGTGGAARAVIVAAHHAKARAIIVHARRPVAARAMVDVAACLGLDGVVAAERPSVAGATIAVIATSALDDPGAWLDAALSGPGAVHDLRYGARAHGVRNAALSRGHLFMDGTLLLLEQGRLALSAFVRAPVPDDAAAAMRRALASWLKELDPRHIDDGRGRLRGADDDGD